MISARQPNRYHYGDNEWQHRDGQQMTQYDRHLLHRITEGLPCLLLLLLRPLLRLDILPHVLEVTR